MLESKKAKVTLVFILFSATVVGAQFHFSGSGTDLSGVLGLLEVVAMSYYGSQGAVDATAKWKTPRPPRDP